MINGNHVFLGDALSLLDSVPDGSIDLVICDGPYGKSADDWDRIADIQSFNLDLIRRFSAKLKKGGALYLFGKHDCVDFIDYRPFLTLRSRIVWFSPSRLAQGRINYTNNYDIICFFVKGGRPSRFNLDDIRVPQLVELEHRLRCERVPSVANGRYHKTRFHRDGKNPGNVWGDIKQLTYKSKELVSRKTLNTVQKPLKLMERLVLASSSPGDLVLDPFCGVGTTLVACEKLGRRYIGFEINPDHATVSKKRLQEIRFACNQAA